MECSFIVFAPSFYYIKSITISVNLTSMHNRGHFALSAVKNRTSSPGNKTFFGIQQFKSSSN